MSTPALPALAAQMVAQGKGLLAIDESIGTCNRRFAALGIAQTVDRRRAWRDLIVTTPGLAESIGAIILNEETIGQTTVSGTPFATAVVEAGIVPGVKVDAGTIDLAGHAPERITEGLDELSGRLNGFVAMGARFAKWRGVITIDTGFPSRGCIEANAQTLARYAAVCQQVGVLPVVEPEVLMDGPHDLARCAAVTAAVLHAFFRHADEQGVVLEAMILKANMVLPGTTCPNQSDLATIADATVSTLRHAVPAAVPAITFLSGGQAGELASARLNAMNVRFRGRMPWELGFSFARAIQQPALAIWGGDDGQREASQHALAHRARCDRAARKGTYDPTMDSATFPRTVSAQ
ncbi:class I fructose-bisphosphate aldolase [Sphingomonas sp. PAMC 26621]|uniref:class I fructose-bisphosphate aldolase n=1 Tax=Sphingomonas sp. PAMC 26621 TaxID=1112213 RepID=UPI0002E5E3CC|nr:class I fructose-bisphosphate aldolase [Sphingomonas sp. PAMC 26621]